jgi:hypothetical protein
VRHGRSRHAHIAADHHRSGAGIDHHAGRGLAGTTSRFSTMLMNATR